MTLTPDQLAQVGLMAGIMGGLVGGAVFTAATMTVNALTWAAGKVAARLRRRATPVGVAL